MSTDHTHESEFISNLVKRTWVYQQRHGRDAVGLSHSGLKIKRIYRINNASKRTIYEREKLMMMPVRKVPQQLVEKAILTSATLGDDMETGNASPKAEVAMSHSNTHASLSANESSVVTLIDEIQQPTVHRQPKHLRTPSKPKQQALGKNEAYLFHGTKIENIQDIIENGFDLNKSKAGLYGKAIYLAECSEKADQYTDTKLKRRKQCLTMFLVRTALGTIKHHEEEGPTRLPLRGALGVRSNGFDSVLAGSQKRFREFLVFDARQCYPEYLIVYDRV